MTVINNEGLTKGLAINEVHEGDCLELMQEIPDESIDMVLADLPYGTTACKWDTVIPFESLWEQYERIIKSDGAIVLTASQPFTSALVMSNPKLFRYELIWEKSRPTNSFMRKVQPLRYHENILVFSKSTAHNMSKNPMKYYPQMLPKDENKKRTPRNVTEHTLKDSVYGENRKLKVDDGTRSMADDVYPKSVMLFHRDSSSGFHPTQKPVALFEYLIRTYTNEREVVLDNCIGSGTTGVAALNTGRNFIGIEKEPEYVMIARRRIDEAKAVLVNER